jgi:hypothetical protein
MHRAGKDNVPCRVVRRELLQLYSCLEACLAQWYCWKAISILQELTEHALLVLAKLARENRFPD